MTAGAGPFPKNAVDVLRAAGRVTDGRDIAVASADEVVTLPALILAPAGPVKIGAANRVLELKFSKPLAKEGRLGFWRWTLMLLGIAGTYRKNDSVDVQYDLHGRTALATNLDIEERTHPEFP